LIYFVTRVKVPQLQLRSFWCRNSYSLKDYRWES